MVVVVELLVQLVLVAEPFVVDKPLVAVVVAAVVVASSASIACTLHIASSWPWKKELV